MNKTIILIVTPLFIWTPFQTLYYLSENLIAQGIEPRPGSVARNSNVRQFWEKVFESFFITDLFSELYGQRLYMHHIAKILCTKVQETPRLYAYARGYLTRLKELRPATGVHAMGRIIRPVLCYVSLRFARRTRELFKLNRNHLRCMTELQTDAVAWKYIFSNGI
jgi:hypothetical protein